MRALMSNRSTRRKTCPSVTLQNTNMIRTDLELKPVLRADSERQALDYYYYYY